MKQCHILGQVLFDKGKAGLDFQSINFIYKLPHELLNNLKLKIVGNQEILRKPESWFKAEPSNQSLFHKLDWP